MLRLNYAEHGFASQCSGIPQISHGKKQLHCTGAKLKSPKLDASIPRSRCVQANKVAN